MSTATARFTIRQYDQRIEAGVFDPPNPRHFELIHGEIRPMSPIGFRHENGVDSLIYWSRQSLDASLMRVRIQQSIGLPALESVPQPDVAWVARKKYLDRPEASDVLLVIEVSDSTLHFDQTEKATIYAEAAIPDYWIVNIPDESIEVRRDPSPTGYRTTTTYRSGQQVHPRNFPSLKLNVEELFAEISDQP